MRAILDRGFERRALIAVVFAFAVLLMPAAARGDRPLISAEAVEAKAAPGGLEGACGLAVGGGLIYVSNYYRHAIDVFATSGSFEFRLPYTTPGGPCQLARSPAGQLYVNNWHESAARLLPSALELDSAESTGVAVDPASGNVYVDDRTYVAVYDSAGAALGQVGLGSLGEGYGIAAAAGRLYVPDAADATVKVYEPGIDPLDPVAVIDGSPLPAGRFT
jgi:DNA-binding beta-propeller fold protein YncE